MVANYTEVRSATLDAETPVPATFRAHAIDRFNAARDGDHQLYLDWLGVPGREIAKAPQDPATAEAIGHAAATGQTAPRSEWLDDADGTVFRTIAPSVDRKSTRLNSSPSCASRMPSPACKQKRSTQ